MINRRMFLCSTASLTLASAGAARAETACLMPTQARQAGMSPADVIAALKEGNARFAAGAMRNCDLNAMVRETSEGQYPIAAVVGCIDSRVPPELVFDQKIGDLFTARIAGNCVNTDIIGSLEFACKVSGSKAIVVLGHSSCGAVKGAIDKVELGHLTHALQLIEPAVAAVAPTNRTSKDKALVQKVAEKNAELTVAKILSESPILKDMADAGEIVVMAAMHDIATGEIRFL
ncbi:carbonic anhydrase family protein [Paracoccus sp. P2]|uniref:carbonic anhydrase family protein n=1 Tax=Paracoccus TaxID=265 RepID=UPI00049114C6|nr:carbonic anhydrase family protein [Paracoccus pantotrophus]MDF3856473.1 carbonic anhydrase family protein [Paracoccus pantotrophus]RDD93638.1 carbonic anhydrase [Paracoccus pantotrophus]RNI20778.1 carbonic anhydrase [Paracoccus pantotrophus]WGR65455.1 carbonic anhydrase [Paracoccus pantotrophus]SFP18348.1 carbonic anhydrase [Paracoccus pantotrophus]